MRDVEINGGDPIAPPGAIGVAAVYAAKARILFLRRARAEPFNLPRQRRNKRVRDRRRPAETLLRLRSREILCSRLECSNGASDSLT
jgi:hypothetical protein